MTTSFTDQVHTAVRIVLKGVSGGIFMEGSNEPIVRGLDKLRGIGILTAVASEGDPDVQAEAKTIVKEAKKLLNDALDSTPGSAARVKARKCLMENFL